MHSWPRISGAGLKASLASHVSKDFFCSQLVAEALKVLGVIPRGKQHKRCSVLLQDVVVGCGFNLLLSR